MTRAALAPLAGRTGLSVATDTGVPVLARTFEVGRLVDLDKPMDHQFKERRIEPDDCAAFAAELVALLRGQGVTRLAIEIAAGSILRAARSRLIGEAVSAACTWAGIEVVEYDAKTWRSKLGAIRPGWPLEVKDVPEAVLREAIGLLLADLAASGVEVAHHEGPRLIVSASPTVSTVPTGDAPTERAEPDLVNVPAPTGPRVMGIDPGARHCAVCVGEGAAAPLVPLLAHTFKVGEIEALPKPRPRGDGTWQTTRFFITDAHLRALCEAIERVAVAYGVTRVIIEAVIHARLSSHAKANAINRASRLDGAIGAWLEVKGFTIERVPAITTRARVVGGPGKDRAERIPAAVAAGFVGWPASSDDHERDAAVCALYAVTQVPVASRSRVPCGTKKPRPKLRPYLERERAARLAERVAAGCTCGPRHKDKCPLRRSNKSMAGA